VTIFGLWVGSAHARAEVQSNDLIGAWSWVSVHTTTADGKTTEPFGTEPQGLLVFDSSGKFSWLISHPGRARFVANRRDLGTDAENKATVTGSLGYTGTYRMNGDMLVFKIEAATYPNEEGAEQRRRLSLDGDELKWTNPTTSAGTSGVAVLRRIK
jgi:hypothetical protein